MSDGTVRRVPPELSKIIEQASQTLAANGCVTVGTMPDELTSNAAADVLGISRPTLSKLAKAGELDSFKVGCASCSPRGTQLPRTRGSVEWTLAGEMACGQARPG